LKDECDSESLLNELNKAERWNTFLESKKDKRYIPETIINRFNKFITESKYERISAEISDGTYDFSIPKKKQINKTKVGKKRDVYMYNKNETMVLKMVAYLLHIHDDLFAPNLYSFRTDTGVKKAIYDIMRIRELNKMHGYKVDIKNYFNSVNAEKLLVNLEEEFKDDKRLYELFHRTLSNPLVDSHGELIEEQKGIMAGVPTSAFLANFYLNEMDWYFYDNGIIYFRYADDILVFSSTKEELESHKTKIGSFLAEKDLAINTSKEFFYEPHEKFEFLGFSIDDKTIDLSENTIRKIKAKIKRASRSIRRWGAKKNASGDACLKTMINKFDKKFFGKEENELSWKYWFFPTINTIESLKEVDNYMQERLRYVVTGRYSKKNYEEVPYERLKNCGYRPLVHEYYAENDISKIPIKES